MKGRVLPAAARVAALTAVAVVVVALAAGRAARAYPQFQLVRAPTCSACHRSPAGGGLLTENGLDVAEVDSQWGGAPEFLHDALPLPDWLQLGGELRGAAGVDGVGPARRFAAFPMQAELEAAATRGAWSAHVTAGLRDPQWGNTAATLFASREHYVAWAQHPDLADGLTVRAGRFLPVFGLRFAEHPFYDRRYAGSPLYGEAYALAAEYVAPGWELHATGFVHDPFLADAVERGDGGALYAEARPRGGTAVGAEAKLDVTPDDRHVYAGVVAKQKVGDGLIAAELVYVRQHVSAGGGHEDQLVGNVVGSYFVGPVMIDLGAGVVHENLAVLLQDQEAVDLDAHWFATAHLELLWTSRLQLQAFGADGYTSGYSLVQVHYRL